MLKSMTGFGRSTVEFDGREITIELKSVNHKYLDIGFRMPRSLSFLEDSIRSRISSNISRGHINVDVTYRNNREDSKSVIINDDLIKSYIESGERVIAQYGLRNDMSVMNVLRLPEVIEVIETEDDNDEITKIAQIAVDNAVSGLVKMREIEGERLKSDLLKKIDSIDNIWKSLNVETPNIVLENAKKLADKIDKLMPQGIAVDESRLATEIALMADKACVDEELVRIRTHICNLRNMLEENEPIGRKADFLIQELNREFNTTGSKSNDTGISGLVISGKAEIEKLREQIQNIE